MGGAGTFDVHLINKRAPPPRAGISPPAKHQLKAKIVGSTSTKKTTIVNSVPKKASKSKIEALQGSS